MAKLTFLGAAGCVTGSKYLVEAAGKKLLVDCGLFQGTNELKDRNWKPLPVDPGAIDYAMLTHAHLDHTGWLPVLVRDGYRGPIFANPATIELTEILLKDSAHLQEEETEHAKKKKYSRHAEPRSLYTPDDVEPVLKQLKIMPRLGGFDISPEFHVASFDAGHILGSSSLELTIREGGKKIVVAFSGDIGRYGQPILNEPTTPSSNADVLICESTYGDREHQDGNPEELLAQIVNRVVKRGGSIVIPAFAIGRTQTFMYYLRRLEDQQRIPRIPVYVDSPMALSATHVYIKHGNARDSLLVLEPAQIVHEGLRPSDGKRRNHDRSSALHHAVHDLRQQLLGIAILMLAVAISRLANQHVRVRGRRRRLIQNRLPVAPDVPGKRHDNFLAALADRQLQAR